MDHAKRDIFELVGEDRTFGGNRLFVDLIPNTCWFKNVRSSVDPNDWDCLRNHIYERVNYVCECCGCNTKENGVRLDAHERWDYITGEGVNIQKLTRLVALCEYCHQSTHMGLARIRGKGDEARTHLCKVSGMTKDECNKHISDAFVEWGNRSKIRWELDLSLITSNGIRLKEDSQENVCSLEPMNITGQYWVHYSKNNDRGAAPPPSSEGRGFHDIGKWMLFYDKSLMNEKWAEVVSLYNENKLEGVIKMKCSTNRPNPRASESHKGVIILYCNDSHNSQKILKIGKNILEFLKCTSQHTIYYKTDVQTREGTRATGSNTNNTYKLSNPYYHVMGVDLSKCLL